MIDKTLSLMRSFCSCFPWAKWSNKAGSGLPGAKAALLLLSAVSLSSLAQVPGQITVTALPYVLTNNGGVQINTNYPIKPLPQAVSMSTFGSLMGGGFGAIKAEFPATYGGVSAMIAVNKVKIFADEASQVRAQAQVKQFELNAVDTTETKLSNATQCTTTNVVQANGLMPRLVTSRIKARRIRNGFPRMAEAETCDLPQEEEAEELEQEVETLTESETASQEALETAETAAEAAEVAAEAAEEAVEAALESVEILETILEACSLF